MDVFLGRIRAPWWERTEADRRGASMPRVGGVVGAFSYAARVGARVWAQTKPRPQSHVDVETRARFFSPPVAAANLRNLYYDVAGFTALVPLRCEGLARQQ